MKIQKLFSNDPTKWTRGANARNIHAAKVSFNSKSAVCWCLFGAGVKCYGLARWDDICDKVAAKVGCTIPEWNDAPERTFEDVKALVEELDI